MAVEDLWQRRDGTRSARYGRGKRWRVRYRDFPARSFRTQQAARDWERELRDRAEQPHVQDVQAVQVGALLDRWLAGKRELSKSGQSGCRNGAAHCRPRWGGLHPSEVTTQAIREWVPTIQGAASLRIKTLQALHGALQIAVEEKIIGANPCVGVAYPKERPREAHYLTERQVSRLAVAAGRYGPMVWFMATTGLRIGEVIALRVGDVSVRSGRVRVRSEDVGASKGDARDVGVPPKVISMLDLGRSRSAPLFCGPRGGRLNYWRWRQEFDEAVWLAWLDGVHPHDLRHTAVSLAAQSGINPMVTQRMVGHKRPIMTGRYSHLYDADLDAAAIKLDNLIPD